MNRRTLVSGATACILTMPYVARAAQDRTTLRQRTFDHPPLCMRLRSGGWSGFEVETSEMFCARAGATLKPADEYYTWPRALKMMESGDLDLLPGVTWREERTRYLDFIGPFGRVDICIIVRRENADARFDSLDDFMTGDRMFTLLPSAVVEPEFDKRLKSDPAFAAHFIGTVTTAHSQNTGLVTALGSRVASGRVFGAITNVLTYETLQMMKAADVPFDRSALTYISPSIFPSMPNYLTASMHVDPSIRAKLHDAYREARKDGSFELTWRRWFKDQAMPPVGNL